MKEADWFAARILPTAQAIQSCGAASLAEIAEALNGRGIRNARGGRWHVSLLNRALGVGVL